MRINLKLLKYKESIIDLPFFLYRQQDISKINKLLKQFKMMSDMMKKMSKGKGIPSGNIPDELLNQLK